MGFFVQEVTKVVSLCKLVEKQSGVPMHIKWSRYLGDMWLLLNLSKFDLNFECIEFGHKSDDSSIVIYMSGYHFI